MQFISIYTNIVTGEHYSPEGKSYEIGFPEIYVNSQFHLYWQLYSSTPDANMASVDVSNWKKTTRYAGCVAKFTCDNDWVHRVSGKLKLDNEILAGEEFPEIIKVTVQNAATSDISSSGEITLYNTQGQYEHVLFHSREISGNIVSLYVGSGIIAKHNHSTEENATISQEVLFQAFTDQELSDASKGLFVFNVIVNSLKLQKIIDTINSGTIPIKALELLPYMIMEDGSIVQYPAIQYEKATLKTTMAEAGTPAMPGNLLKSEIVLEIQKQFENLSITDAGDYYESDTIEGALQEIGATLNGLEAELAEV